MKDSPLAALAAERQNSLKTHDQQVFSQEHVENEANWPQLNTSLKNALARNHSPLPKVLAEIKKASPTKGSLSELPAETLCQNYVDAGIQCLSILTDPVHFNGSVNDIVNCREAHPDIPILFKDFVTTPYQIHLARTCGANAVLLMCQLLDEQLLRDLYALSLEIGLEPFVEVHEIHELEFAAKLSPPIIGINSRDFMSEGMPIDLGTAGKLLHQLNDELTHKISDTIIVAQSGISSLEDVRAIDESCPGERPDAIQIGSHLSESDGDFSWLKKLLI